MKQLAYLLICLLILITGACVGPEEYDDGLLENLPAVINTADVLSLSLKANNYTFNESYPLELTFVDSVDLLAISLTVTGYGGKGKDTTLLELYDAENQLMLYIPITVNGVVNSIYRAELIKPHRVKIQGDNITGTITFMITKQTDTVGPVFGAEVNLPVIVDWNDNFTYLLDAQNFTFNHSYPVELNLSDTTSIIYSSLFVGAFVSGTGSVTLFDASDSLLRRWDINEAVIDFQQDIVNTFKPSKIQVSGNELTGVLEFILSK